MTNLFIYGTLRHLPLLRVVLDHDDFQAVSATIEDFRLFRVEGEAHPAIRPSKGDQTTGLLLQGLSDGDIARLDYYEFDSEFGYDQTPVTAIPEGAETPVAAIMYLPQASWPEGGAFDLKTWEEEEAPVILNAAIEYMDHFGRLSAEDADPLFPMMLDRAAARVRATRHVKPVTLRSGLGADGVRVDETRRPYTGFFALQEARLSFPTFAGGMSQPIERSAFIGGEAVLVLPYDPVRDRVLIVEQFRFGAFVRGDPTPWQLEAPAGRIDLGETPEETARRELLEECGVAAKRLIPLSRHYPTPGAHTEYHHAFVAICDLPDDAAGIGGLEVEGEDIRSHILSYDRAMDLLDDGEADCGPLIICLLWLSRIRDQLRNAG